MPLLFCGSATSAGAGLNHLCMSMACVGLSYALGRHRRAGAWCPSRTVTVLPDACHDLQGALVEPTAVAAYGVDTRRRPPGRHAC